MRSQPREEDDLQANGIVAFQAPRDLISRIEQAAANEGISKSAIARRAVMRDLERTAAA